MENLIFNEWSVSSEFNNIECFELDLDIYNNIFKKSPRLKKNVQENKELLSTFDKLSEDIYLSLFKAEPIIKDRQLMNVKYRFNNMIIKNLLDTDEIEPLRKNSSVNYFNSILATEILAQEIINNYKKLLDTDKDFIAEVKRYRENIKTYASLEKSSDKLEEIENNIDKNIDNLEKMMSNSNLIYKSVSFSYKEFLTIFNTVKFWGLDDGKLNPTSYDEKVAVASKLRTFKKIKQLSEMVGRFRSSASNLQKRKTKEEGQEICGVQLGNEIHKVLPSEKLLLANEKTKKSFYKKYYQKELLSYKYKNNRIRSKGPIICCIDTSSSMEGELEIWSKSVAMALLDIAYKQKRDFVAILFSYRVGEIIEFNKNKVEPSKIYSLATSFYGSGTNFIEPLTESLKLINNSKYKYADVVFITDGEAPLDEEFIEYFNNQKEEKQFRMIAVNVSDKIEEALNQINDTQILLRDLTDETVEETNEVLFTI